MIDNFIMFFLPILSFGLYFIFSDFSLKNPDKGIFVLFLITMSIVFISNIFLYSWLDFTVLLMMYLVAFLLYFFKFFSKYDFAIFVGLCMSFIALTNTDIFFSFLINFICFYILGLFFLYIVFASLKDKKEAAIKVDVGFNLLFLVLIFLFIRKLIRSVLFENPLYLLAFVIFVIIIIKYLSKLLKKYYDNFKYNLLKLFFIILLFAIFLIISSLNIIIYFLIILFLRLVLEFFSNLYDLSHDKYKENIEGIMIVCMFLSAIFSYIIQSDIIGIIIQMIL